MPVAWAHYVSSHSPQKWSKTSFLIILQMLVQSCTAVIALHKEICFLRFFFVCTLVPSTTTVHLELYLQEVLTDQVELVAISYALGILWGVNIDFCVITDVTISSPMFANVLEIVFDLFPVSSWPLIAWCLGQMHPCVSQEDATYPAALLPDGILLWGWE